MMLTPRTYPVIQEHSLPLKKLISPGPEDALLKIRRPVYKRLFKINRVLRAVKKKRCKSNLSIVSVHANRSLDQDLMLSARVPWNDGLRCYSTGSHSFPSLNLRFFHPFPKQRACSQAR